MIERPKYEEWNEYEAKIFKEYSDKLLGNLNDYRSLLMLEFGLDQPRIDTAFANVLIYLAAEIASENARRSDNREPSLEIFKQAAEDAFNQANGNKR